MEKLRFIGILAYPKISVVNITIFVNNHFFLSTDSGQWKLFIAQTKVKKKKFITVYIQCGYRGSSINVVRLEILLFFNA